VVVAAVAAAGAVTAVVVETTAGRTSDLPDCL